MVVVFITVLLLYFLMMIFFIAGWNKVIHRPFSDDKKVNHELISVLVPVRNEMSNISSLLNDLLQQDDPLFEIIVINDHSNDNTFNVVSELVREFGNLKIINLTGGEGKKKALERGIKEAKGSIIVTTDADCRVNPEWVSTFRKALTNQNIKLAFGGVRIKQDGTFWSSVQAMEFASLIGSGAALSSWDKPLMCNGANLAYRKKNFEEVNGYEGNLHIASGDDEFLLKKISRQYPGGIRFVADSYNVVETKGVTLSGFVHQRVRWAGKWNSNEVTSSTFLALFIFGFHFVFLAMIGWGIVTNNYIFMAGSFFVKLVLEIIFLRKVMRFLDSPWSWGAFVLLTMAYSFYAVLFGLLSNLSAPVWKGRKIKQMNFKIEPGFSRNH